MSKKIEILENTLLKLLVRRGADLDRKNITLSEGELGYTKDGKRLFVGDGQTAGGSVAGNKFHGIVADINVVTFMLPGDLVYVTTDKTLYVRNEANTSWEVVSVVLEPADGTIVIGDSQISVGTLSAGNFSDDMAGNSIEIDTNGRIALSSTQILTDQINTKTASHLKLPQSININNTEYEFPVGGVQNNTFLGTDASGNLSWKASDKSTSIFFNSSAAAIPVGAMVEAGTLTLMPDTWLLADGQTVASSQFPDLYNAIGTTYGGDATNFQVPDESAEGFIFIKALPDEVLQADVTYTNGLTATKDGLDVTGVPQSPLSGSFEVGLPVPGSFVSTTSGAGTFTTKATYTKFWLTGSGARGGHWSGGAAGTVTGVISAPIGTDVNYTVAAGIPLTNNTDGNDSFMSIDNGVDPEVEVARSFGAVWKYIGTDPYWTNTGTLSTTGTGLADGESPYILCGHIIGGGCGGHDTNGGGDEEVGATASFWGADYVPGAGSGSHGKYSWPTADGLIKFEWGM